MGAGVAHRHHGARDPIADVKAHGNKHVAFRVKDIEPFLAEMAEKRFSLRWRKKAGNAFVVREKFGAACFLRDCAGDLIEFVEDKTID